jgi:peptidoglycan-N-acetylglucosamine deacetylase
MKIRFGTLVAISILVVLAFSLAACEKDRPVPTPTRAATAVATTRTPQANATPLALPAVSGGAAVTGTQGSAAGSPSATQAPQASTGATQQPTAAGNGQSFTYTVAKGDSLTGLAKKFGVTQESILTLNGLTNPDSIQAGQTLKIPGQNTSATGTGASGGATTYTVVAGDTLSKIAVKLGVTTKQIIAANNLANPDVLTIGKVLTIPTGGTTTGSAGTTTGASGATTYVVQSGDTLAQIAARNGVTLNQLMVANNITNADRIYSGQTLKIP